jgi:hypothetical protein
MICEQFLSREPNMTRKESRVRANNIMAEVFSKPFACMWVRPDVQSSSLADCVFHITAPPKMKKWKITYDIISADSSKETTEHSDGLLSFLETD